MSRAICDDSITTCSVQPFLPFHATVWFARSPRVWSPVTSPPGRSYPVSLLPRTLIDSWTTDRLGNCRTN
ncbi:hypothetical protein RRG08_043763 [Elysia crispata]|uniref:Uncharacterized protein n=1 Tax=Elysia crispata TaxID=231223 RepID=A0AAE0ZNQ2_9GAST|nr:hypothetical protein RRG08_043763 [Elysia crispata]